MTGVLLSEQEKERYAKQISVSDFGLEGQLKLKSAKVLVVGAGGLGCPSLQYLAGSGVGKIGIADGDNIEVSNLPRQILYGEKDLGKKKVIIASEKLSGDNPHIQITPHPVHLSISNVEGIFRDYDIILDCTDNFPTRYLINDTCVRYDKILISGTVSDFGGQVSVFNYKNGPTYRCLFPEPPPEEEVPNCSSAGIIGIVPGICGMLQANEAIKIICELRGVLSGRLLCFNLLTLDFTSFSFPRSVQNYAQTPSAQDGDSCREERLVGWSDFKKMKSENQPFQLIDVREPEEYIVNNMNGVSIPLGTLLLHLDKINREIPVIIHCKSGPRSKKAVKILAEQGFSNAFYLEGGMLGMGNG